ncbi:MAG: DUF559 domain-containing protein [Fimbriimonas sp.]
MNEERRYEEQQRLRTAPEEMSPAAQWLWSEVRDRKLGFRFQRQLLIGHLLVDFYCPEASLAIELVDEGSERQASRESRKDESLADRGVAMMRVPAEALLDETTRPEWIHKIHEACWDRSHRG